MSGMSGKLIWMCPETNTSGTAWVSVLGNLVPVTYRDDNPTWRYFKTEQLWFAENRTTKALWVYMNGWQEYNDFWVNQEAIKGLQSLTDVLRVCAGSSECIAFKMDDFFGDMCRVWYATAWFYEIAYSAPRISAPDWCPF